MAKIFYLAAVYGSAAALFAVWGAAAIDRFKHRHK